MLHCTVSVALAHTHTHSHSMVSNNFAKATFHPTVDRKPTQIADYQVWYWKRCKTRSPKDLLLELGKLILPINQKFGYHFEASQQTKKKSVWGAIFSRTFFFQQSAFRYNENNTHFILRRASTVFDAFWYFDRTWLINEIRVLRGILFQKTYNAFEKQKKRGRSKGAATLFLVYLWSILLHVGFRMRMFGHFLFSL